MCKVALQCTFAHAHLFTVNQLHCAIQLTASILGKQQPITELLAFKVQVLVVFSTLKAYHHGVASMTELAMSIYADPPYVPFPKE